jgi:hypothetical protein
MTFFSRDMQSSVERHNEKVGQYRRVVVGGGGWLEGDPTVSMVSWSEESWKRYERAVSGRTRSLGWRDILTDGNGWHMLALQHWILSRSSHGTVRSEHGGSLVKIQCCFNDREETGKGLGITQDRAESKPWPRRTDPPGEAPSVLDRDPKGVQTS